MAPRASHRPPPPAVAAATDRHGQRTAFLIGPSSCQSAGIPAPSGVGLGGLRRRGAGAAMPGSGGPARPEAGRWPRAPSAAGHRPSKRPHRHEPQPSRSSSQPPPGLGPRPPQRRCVRGPRDELSPHPASPAAVAPPWPPRVSRPPLRGQIWFLYV